MIALTHMVWTFDEQLAAEVEEIDLVLAGHDHDYGVKCVSRIEVILIIISAIWDLIISLGEDLKDELMRLIKKVSVYVKMYHNTGFVLCYALIFRRPTNLFFDNNL